MPKVRFGVIGCGSITQKAFLPALKKSSCAELTAIASRSLKKAEECAAGYGVTAVEGYKELILRNDIDAVYIATPIGTHAEIATLASSHGKHVLCEKSLTSSLPQANELVATCKKNGTALLEGFMYQFHPQHQRVKELVAEGELGDPLLFQGFFGFPPFPNDNIRYNAKLGGGALLDAGAYPVHAARSFFGSEPTAIAACASSEQYPVDIHGSVLLSFGGSRSAVIAYGFDNYYRNTYSIWGTKGQITLTRAFSMPADFTPTIVVEQQGKRREIVIDPYDHFVAEIEAFCEGLADLQTQSHWYDDALCQAKVLAKIKEASTLQRG